MIKNVDLIDKVSSHPRQKNKQTTESNSMVRIYRIKEDIYLNQELESRTDGGKKHTREGHNG